MGRAHEAVRYVENKTDLADEVHVTAEEGPYDDA